MKSILVPALQPIQDIVNCRISHYEALTRLRNNDTANGHWPLIRLAEQYRFIGYIDLAMLEMVLDLLRDTRDTVVAVNVSAVTIESRFADFFVILDGAPEIIDRLVIEITETSPIRDIERVLCFVAEVRARGCKVALDDFGNKAGCISVEVVEAVKPDFLKLDRDILSAALNGGEHLVEAVALAAAVGARVVAEFVDSHEKVELLIAAGVRYAQGQVFGMPERYPLSFFEKTKFCRSACILQSDILNSH